MTIDEANYLLKSYKMGFIVEKRGNGFLLKCGEGFIDVKSPQGAVNLAALIYFIGDLPTRN
jgi:hypothetical protein